MDEAAPFRYDPARAAPLAALLERRAIAPVGAASCAESVNMIRFYVALYRYDAYLLADRLNQAGIKAHVFNQHASSIVGDVPPDVAQPQVWLAHDHDRERAEALLRTLQEEAARGGSVRCRHCSEESPANFDLCWKCGAALVP
jgi:hypothetical protein